MTDQGYDLDLFVIGAGSGGVRASRVAAGLGARVAVCEERALGGTCVNAGCVPKKLLVHGSQFSGHFADAAGFGWTLPEAPRFDWPSLVAAKDKEIARLNAVYQRMLEGSGVEIVTGRGRLVDAHTVAVGERRFRARHILIATGGWPTPPDFPGAELAVSSNELFHLPELPRRIIMVGGGYVGTEFVGIFRGLGAEVTLVHRGELVLKGFDEDVRRTLTDGLGRRGVGLRLGRTVARLERRGSAGELAMTLDDGSVLEADLVVCACGRLPLTVGLGLEEAGVTTNAWGYVEVDERFRTRAPSVLAVGDVVGRAELTPVALAEGTWVAQSLFGSGDAAPLDYALVATAVFSQPEVATVGLTEAAARARYGDVAVFRSEFTPMKYTLCGRGEKTLMKLVVDRASDRLLGCHVVGPEAAEIVQGFAVALTCGATKAQIDATLGIHPTAAEELVTMRTPVS